MMEIDTQAVMDGLSALRDINRLAANALINLRCVTSRLDPSEHGHRLERASALRQIFEEALLALKPSTGDGDPTNTDWHGFLILHNQFVLGQRHEAIASRLSISKSEFYRRRAQAIQTLLETLRHIEVRSTLGDNTIGVDTAAQRIHTRLAVLMPAPRYDFLIGRDNLMALIRQRLMQRNEDHDPNALALWGLPGAGKTTLAAEVGRHPDVQQAFDAGVLWAALGRTPDIDAIAFAWATALGIERDRLTALPSTTERLQLLRTLIASRRVLLIIDDVWSAHTASILRVGGEHSALLITTRLPEIARTMAGQNAIHMDDLSEADSVEMLKRYAAEAVTERPADVAALAQSLGGLPLSLMLCGRYLRQHSYSGQARRLEQAIAALFQPHFRLALTSDMTPDVTSHTTSEVALERSGMTVASMIELSVLALDENSRTALHRLAVFSPKPAHFSEEAALFVTEEPTTSLDKLVDYGLLDALADGRYQMHQVISDYARLQAVDQYACQRLCTYYATFANANQLDFIVLDREFANIRNAIDVACLNRHVMQAVRLTQAMNSFMQSRGLHEQARTWLIQSLPACEALNNARYMAKHEVLLAQHAEQSTDPAEAERHWQNALHHGSETSDPELMWLVYEGLATTSQNRKDYAEAALRCRQALTAAREARQLHAYTRLLARLAEVSTNLPAHSVSQDTLDAVLVNEAMQLWFKGVQMYLSGQAAPARQLLEQALDRGRASGDPSATITPLGFLSLVCVTVGDFDAAAQYASEGLALRVKAVFPRSIGFLYSSLGISLCRRGDYEPSIAILTQGINEAQRDGLAENESWLMMALSRTYLFQGHIAEAHRWAQMSLALCRQNSQFDVIAYPTAQCGLIAALQRNTDEAHTYFREIDVILSSDQAVWQRAFVRVVQGESLVISNQWSEAGRVLREALDLAGMLGAREYAAQAHFGLAQVAAYAGHHHEAREQANASLTTYRELRHIKAETVADWLRDLQPIQAVSREP